MSLHYAEPYTVREYTIGRSKGRPTEFVANTTTPKCMVTPLSDRDLKDLAEGLRADAKFRVRTKASFGDLGDQSSTQDWRIEIDGREYQIRGWGRWSRSKFGPNRHNKYVALEIPE